MLTYIINIMYFSPLLVILYLGSDVPMKLKVVFLLLLPWSLRWTVINLLVISKSTLVDLYRRNSVSCYIISGLPPVGPTYKAT
ncbi:hypothetical protein Hanom_Chr11g01021121 [Helianthus anomalus]